MQPQSETDTPTDDAPEHWWATVGWRGLQMSALLLWIAVGSYAWLRTVQPALYTITTVGVSLGITLAAGLFGQTAESAVSTLHRQSKDSRLLVAGCLVALLVGSAAVAKSAQQLGVSQPTLPTFAVVGGLLLCGSLLAVAARQSTALAGFAGVAIVVSWASTPDISFVETVVFSDYGIYGPLMRAAVTWIAPACLLVGCWRAAGSEKQLRALWHTTVEEWGTEQRGRGLDRLVAAVGCAVLLIGWQIEAVGSTAIAGLAALSGGLLGAISLRVATHDTTAATTDGRLSIADTPRANWTAPTLLIGVPVVVMTLLGIGYRLPVGTTLVAGWLCCVAGCLARPFVVSGDDTPEPKSGAETILDGCVVGCQLLSRVVVPLAVVGGSLSLLVAAGVTTSLVAGVGWLSGGHSVAVVLAVAVGCVLLGALLSVVGGYAGGALVGVPLLRLLASVPELAAHLVVLSSVVAGWLLVGGKSGPP